MFVIVARLLPTRAATSSWVSEKSSISCWYAAASSSGFSSSRWTFSTIACWSIDASSAVRTIAGIVWSPMRRAARQRRSPAISSKPSPPRADEHRLQHADLADRLRQRGERLLVEVLARLLRDSAGSTAVGISWSPTSSFETTPGRDQRTEPSTQPAGSRHGSPPWPARGRRRAPRDVESNTMIGSPERRRLRDPDRAGDDGPVHLRRRSARAPRARPGPPAWCGRRTSSARCRARRASGLRFDFTSATLRSSWPRPSSA